MKVLEVDTVREALPQGLELLLAEGRWQDSRAGRVLVSPYPVATVYRRPFDCVLRSPLRDANPFFHLAEAVWMLGGHRDARLLNHYVGDYSSRFAEDDGLQHGAYGFRWREHWGPEDEVAPLDQLEVIAQKLSINPNDRQVVLQMWDPMADLQAKKRDIPCNTQAYFRVVDGALNMTVCCRSNDIIWGAYGANAVHFAFLLEYMAGASGFRTGTYTQFSNNYHAYEAFLQKLCDRAGTSNMHNLPEFLEDDRGRVHGSELALIWDAEVFREEARDLVEMDPSRLQSVPLREAYLANVVAPALASHHMWKQGHRADALVLAQNIGCPGWRGACVEWLERRQ